MVLRGKIKFFNAERGWGFITRRPGGDLFVHISSVEGGETPQIDDECEFEIGTDERSGRPQARNVKLIGWGGKAGEGNGDDRSAA